MEHFAPIYLFFPQTQSVMCLFLPPQHHKLCVNGIITLQNDGLSSLYLATKQGHACCLVNG